MKMRRKRKERSWGTILKKKFSFVIWRLVVCSGVNRINTILSSWQSRNFFGQPFDYWGDLSNKKNQDGNLFSSFQRCKTSMKKVKLFQLISYKVWIDITSVIKSLIVRFKTEDIKFNKVLHVRVAQLQTSFKNSPFKAPG